jgi:hypothetical protein
MQRINDKALLETLSKKGLLVLDRRGAEHKIADGKTTFKHDGDQFEIRLVGKENQLFLITN